MSHNPFALLNDEDDAASEHSADVAATTKAASRSSATFTSVKVESEDDEEMEVGVPAASRRSKKKAIKKIKKARLEAQSMHQAAQQSAAQREAAAEAEDQQDENGIDDDDDIEDEEKDGELDDSDDDAEANPQSGKGTAKTLAEANLTPQEVAAAARTLLLLDIHPDLLEDTGMKSVRKALGPLVQKLSTKWHGRVLGTMSKRAKKAAKGANAARIEYELALDASARNATAIRATRLKKLESLNNMIDSDALGEAAQTIKAMRVPDGVAITDGMGDDVCMKLLTDGSSSSKNSNRLLLTSGADHDAASNRLRAQAATTPAIKEVALGEVDTEAAQSSTTLINPLSCYTCKAPYKTLHHFYDSLCPSCAKLNFAKRDIKVDLTGKIILLTGARVKIGYRILIKLLRNNAFVIATTRFPHDLSTRLKLERDFETWRDKVHIYGLDFRNLQVLEEFVAKMYATYTHLDAIINNACQTVRRPPAYYKHLIEGERMAFEDLSKDAQQLLVHHHEFAENQMQSQHLALEAGKGSMKRLASGDGGDNIDVTLPPTIEEISSTPTPATTTTSEPPTAPSSSTSAKLKKGASITLVEDDDKMDADEEIVAPSRPKVESTAASTSSSAPATSSSSTISTEQQQPPASRKRSRRGAMRAAEQNAANSQQLTTSTAAAGAAFVHASALAAESTQLSLIPSDNLSAAETAALFPEGERDVNGQQLDLRSKNSWTMKLEDVPIGEAAEVMAINCLAPFLLNSKLKALMIKGNEDKSVPRFIVNVSAMEGKFYRFKSANHPHTNAAKAALNMMTRTSAQDYVNSMIFMTAVDTGWINDENPLPKASQIAQKHNFQTPLDEVDAAARVVDPILTPLKEFAEAKTKKTPKEMKSSIPYGIFIKDYVKCEW